eukprot:8772458-Alexandrium_andersonii.AAC.1
MTAPQGRELPRNPWGAPWQLNETTYNICNWSLLQHLVRLSAFAECLAAGHPLRMPSSADQGRPGHQRLSQRPPLVYPSWQVDG